MRIKYSSNEWVDKWYNNFLCAMKKQAGVFSYDNINNIIARKQDCCLGNFNIIYGFKPRNSEITCNRIIIINSHTGRIGFSKCSTEDTFNLIVGIAIAWARYCGETIPDEISITIPISELVSNDKFYYDKKKFIFIAKSPILNNAYIVYRQAADGSLLLSTLLASEATMVEKI